MAKPPKAADGHPPCPTKFGPPPGKSKNTDPHHSCGKAKGKEANGTKAKDKKTKHKGTKGGIILILPMTVITAAYAVRPERLRPRRRPR